MESHTFRLGTESSDIDLVGGEYRASRPTAREKGGPWWHMFIFKGTSAIYLWKEHCLQALGRINKVVEAKDIYIFSVKKYKSLMIRAYQDSLKRGDIGTGPLAGNQNVMIASCRAMPLPCVHFHFIAVQVWPGVEASRPLAKQSQIYTTDVHTFFNL